jgi:hypothetical protein
MGYCNGNAGIGLVFGSADKRPLMGVLMGDFHIMLILKSLAYLLKYPRTLFSRSPENHLWMGRIKAANSQIWYQDRPHCPEKFHTLPGELYERQQCAVINMSMTVFNDPYMVYATSCNETFNFACTFHIGTVPEGNVGRFLDCTFHIGTVQVGNVGRFYTVVSIQTLRTDNPVHLISTKGTLQVCLVSRGCLLLKINIYNVDKTDSRQRKM